MTPSKVILADPLAATINGVEAESAEPSMQWSGVDWTTSGVDRTDGVVAVVVRVLVISFMCVLPSCER